MKRSLVIGAILGVFCAATVPADAEPLHDSFNGNWIEDNSFLEGGGSGWNGGEWIQYDQMQPFYWTQWFYNDPPNPDRWKEIEYDISFDGDLEGFPYWNKIEIALNWSTVDFPQSGPDGAPPSPDQEQFIERQVIYSDGVFSGSGNIQGTYTIEDFNPEWVSIDIYVEGWQGIDFIPGEVEKHPMLVHVWGDIWHECVPEPSSFVMLFAGVMGLLANRYRKFPL